MNTSLTTTNGFTPSKYQQNIFDAIVRGARALVISAVPGSGKTTTIVQLINYIPAEKSVLAVAFNTDAAKQLSAKISAPNVDARTIHSLGNATLAANKLKSKVQGNKYMILTRQLLNSRNIFDAELTQQVCKLVDMTRLTLTNPNDADALLDLMDRFEIEIATQDYDEDGKLVESEEWTIARQVVPAIIQVGIVQCQTEKIIDYTDMIFLPTALKLSPKRYDVVLVDEAQDLSPAQRTLVLNARKASAQFVAVGDRNQAIYGFAGASLRSIDEIVETLQREGIEVLELPLSICYRCPRVVVDLAASIYPGIEAAPNAADGELQYIVPDKIELLAQAGDLILCRMTAPLITLCLQLLRSGKRANVRGKDLGSTFAALLDKIQKFVHVSNINELPKYAKAYVKRQIEILSRDAEENEMRIDSFQDKIDTLLALFDAYMLQCGAELDDDFITNASIPGFVDYIKKFFAEDKDAQIILSTGHRAKGLEYRRVFILNADQLPHPRAKTPQAIVQEMNLMYVMYTRAMDALYLCVAHVVESVNEVIEETIDAPVTPLLIEAPQQESALPAEELPTSEEEDADEESAGYVTVSVEFINALFALAMSKKEETPTKKEKKAPKAPKAERTGKRGRPASGKADERGRIRKQWQGSYEERTLQFLDELKSAQGVDKSAFVESAIQATTEYKAWNLINPDEDDNNDPNGGGAPTPQTTSEEKADSAIESVSVDLAASNVLDMSAYRKQIPELAQHDEEERAYNHMLIESWTQKLEMDAQTPIEQPSTTETSNSPTRPKSRPARRNRTQKRQSDES